MVIATKCGIHYEDGEMVTDNRPERLRLECDESLRRLGTDRVELLYLHAPDEKVPIAESAGALRRIDGRRQNALGRRVELHGRANGGISRRLPDHGRADAVQHAAARHRKANDSLVPRHNIAVMVYWPLMKGLLAGRLPRERRSNAATAAASTRLRGRRMGAEPGLRGPTARSGRLLRSHGRPTGRQLDDQPTRHHEWRSAAPSGPLKSKKPPARWAGR